MDDTVQTMQPEYDITITDLAHVAEVNVETIRKRIQRGHLRAILVKDQRFPLGKYFIHHEDADDYVARKLNGHNLSNATVEPVAQPVVIEEPLVDSSGRCGACGTTRGNILGDIDEKTRERYGYLCAKCTRLRSEVKDDPVMLEKLAAYLRRTRLDRTP